MSPRAAVAELRSAITSVRAACGADPSCRDLLKQLGDVEETLKEVSYSKEPEGPDHGERLRGALSTASDAADKMFGGGDSQASNLKEAAGTAKAAFADRRKASADEKYSK